MATYQDIKGLRVKYLATDPSVLRSGDVWYNSTSGTLKGNVLIASTTSQTNLSRGGSYNQMASASGGSANAAWVAGGSPPVPSGFNETEEFNGSGWTAGGNMNYSGFNRSGFGTLTAGVAVGGRTPAASVANTELYDGTTWTNNPNAAPVAARGYACGGPQTAGIVFSGHAAPAYPVAVTITQYFDGSAWSVPPATMNTPRANASGCGIQTAALAVSGESGPTPTAPTTVEEYNGSAWATTTSLNTGRGNQGPAMCQGSTTSATMLGGNSPSGVAIENWDGTSWATSPASLVNANSQAGGQGSSSIEILKAGGNSQATCEKYEESTNSITAAAWAAGGNYPAAFQGGAGFGTQTAAVGAGGTPSPTFNLKTFEYDGSSWTAGNDMSRTPTGSPYLSAYISGSGTLAAGWAAGGGYPTAVNNVENYDGTNWTASAVLPATRGGGNCSGPQTSGLYFGGNTGSPPRSALDTTYEYDGEAWTGGGTMNTARQNAGGSGPTGSQTAALCFAGNTPSQTNKTEEYNGTAWTEVTVFPRTASYVGYTGSQTDALAFSGYTSPGSSVTTTTGYDGTNWSSRPNMATGRLMYHNNAGTSTAALCFGGEVYPENAKASV